ncbi:hypothetical protein HC248_02958 [Polaromonas vacuolata]|uniref:DUF3047 domain-containing protein n=1 Tax=Polaromonas vacuolata TaxID=37448 RepID=A0A6H2HCM9_9BURK|nr:DUF3047 domain-containing protein [Polaromonas vacuolata]QJC57628.1 hypothetical protein HC248_02958 [Polaromonas vacuolata]
MLKKRIRIFLVLAGLLQLASCALMQSSPVVNDLAETPSPIDSQNQNQYPDFPLLKQDLLASSNTQAPQSWSHHLLPGKEATQYFAQRLDGRNTVMAQSNSSASMLRQSLHVASADLGQLGFSWKLPSLITGADLTRRDAHDSPVRVVMIFEGDRASFSMKNAMLSELALAITGEPLPYATLSYVWCNSCAPNSVIINPRIDRFREIVLESGSQNLGQWRDYQRNIQVDFQRAFGEAPGALLGIAIMTDTDNTHQKAQAWYGPISMTR